MYCQGWGEERLFQGKGSASREKESLPVSIVGLQLRWLELCGENFACELLCLFCPLSKWILSLLLFAFLSCCCFQYIFLISTCDLYFLYLQFFSSVHCRGEKEGAQANGSVVWRVSVGTLHGGPPFLNHDTFINRAGPEHYLLYNSFQLLVNQGCILPALDSCSTFDMVFPSLLHHFDCEEGGGSRCTVPAFGHPIRCRTGPWQQLQHSSASWRDVHVDISPTSRNVPGADWDACPALHLPLLALCHCICDVLVLGLCFWSQKLDETAQVSDSFQEYLFSSGKMGYLITELV